MIKSPSKHLSLQYLLDVQNNSYRSPTCKVEYYANEVDDMIYEKQLRKDMEQIEKDIKRYNYE